MVTPSNGTTSTKQGILMKLFNAVAVTAAVAVSSLITAGSAEADIYCYPVNSKMCEIKINGVSKQIRKTKDVRNRKIILDGEKVRVFGG